MNWHLMFGYLLFQKKKTYSIFNLPLSTEADGRFRSSGWSIHETWLRRGWTAEQMSILFNWLIDLPARPSHENCIVRLSHAPLICFSTIVIRLYREIMQRDRWQLLFLTYYPSMSWSFRRCLVFMRASSGRVILRVDSDNGKQIQYPN